MEIYILISILYLGFLSVSYLGFKELKSFKRNYSNDKDFNTNKFQNIEDSYSEIVTKTQSLSKSILPHKNFILNLEESYRNSLLKTTDEYETLKLIHNRHMDDNKKEIEKIKEIYETDLSNLTNSYKESISEIISEYETLKLEHENYINTSKEETDKIRKVYEEDKVMENFHNMLNLMNKFKEDQKQIQGYLTETIYKLEKNPERLRLEFKKLFNTHKQQISIIQKTLSELEKSVLNFHNFYTKEISSLRRSFSNQNK